MSEFFSGFFTIAKLLNDVEARAAGALYIRDFSVAKRAGESSAVVSRSDFRWKILGIAALRMSYLFGCT